MASRSSSISDAEKQSSSQHQTPAMPAPRSVVLNVARVAQHVFTTISLVFVACAIDRNIILPGVPTEEIVIVVGSTIAMVALSFHILRPTANKQTVVAIDGLVATFLFAAFMYGATQAAQGHGACAGPSKIGVWDNTRGCVRMEIATGFAAGGFLSFGASAVAALLWL
ncbi:hypothetical protein Micbo1qcDRAFT_193976 [Microdochium bolleyi]|uniref:MARVEL domain-containing protein n=1 Tax=Microdochium bolleyi TaxID=196109 RepID=A0A136J5R9_9PEZI|nr:hypothetical protein Micbo1qcDRAFT_193976 [Microdochium bolleyi]